MGDHRVRYVRQKDGVYYFEATPKMRKAGVKSCRLSKDFTSAVAQADAKLAEWDAIRRGEAGPVAGTMKWLVIQYENSVWYRRLGKRTKYNADLHLKRITDRLGKYGIMHIKRRECREFHENLAAKHGENAANEGVKWLRRILNYAIELEWVEHNFAAGMGLRHARPRRERWSIAEIRAFIAKAIEMGRPQWALAVQLGYDSSQRLSDILALTWHDFDGEGLNFRQGKTDMEVWTPLSAEGLKTLNATKREAIHIIVGDGKRPMSRYYFGRVFREIRAATEMRQDLQFRDLRRTAATEIDAGGGNIEPITGHRPGSPVKKHYIVPNKRAAREAQAARKRDD